jgi:uncharacterized protein YdiU (UPF0061 family)
MNTNHGWNFEHTYTNLPQLFHTRQNPEPCPHSRLVLFNAGLAEDLGLNPAALTSAPEFFTGTTLPETANPVAQAYAGYQFGHFAMLGDGRALLLGEHVTPDGRKFDIQLKGSGRTPYSRNGDGMAALAPMLREYIISEAMYHLGIPTSRSLAVALTGKTVYRDEPLHSAVLTRVASSHIRVGTFNFAAAYGTAEDIRKLADYAVNRHFPWIADGDDKYVLFYREIIRRQASLIAKWQAAGFVHGVMNTDNMAISGETIDYGPCAFMDTYDPDTVFSSIDTHGRYSYKNQPPIGAWNLARLGESLLPLFSEKKDEAASIANSEMDNYKSYYYAFWHECMRSKLGLKSASDDGYITNLLDYMLTNKSDYTNTIRAASNDPSNTPAVIPRNYFVEEALSAAERGDLTKTHELLEALKTPFTESAAYSSTPQTGCGGYKTFCGT